MMLRIQFLFIDEKSDGIFEDMIYAINILLDNNYARFGKYDFHQVIETQI